MTKYVIAGVLIVIIFVLIAIFFAFRKSGSRLEEKRKTRKKAVTKAELEQENKALKAELIELTRKYDNLRLRRSLTERYGTGGEDPHD